MADRVSIGVVFADIAGGSHPLVISGAADDDAIAALAAAYASATGRAHRYEGDRRGESAFVLSAEDDDAEALGWDFIHLPAPLTFSDMRLITGPHDFRTRVQLTGFGGEALFDGFTIWELADAINFGRDALEIWGAMEVVRRMGKAVRRRARRSRRVSADTWIHEGGDVPELLRTAVERQYAWSDDQLATYFELDRAEARQLMAACGYRWSATQRHYFRSPDPEAVN